MDWGARMLQTIGQRFRLGFAQVEDYLLARQQLGQAEERAGAAEQQQQEEEEEDDDEEEEEEEDAIIPMPGQDLVSVGAMVVGTGEQRFQDGAGEEQGFQQRQRRG